MLGIMVNQPYIASLTVGSNVITLPTVSGIGDGFQISGTGIPANTVVFLINGNTITITANATITAANETVYFTDPLSNSTVRAAWPIAGAPFAGISDNFITIQFYEADDDYNKVRNLTFAYNNPTSLDQTYTYTRVWRCNLISRGPNCLDNLRLVKSALLMDWEHKLMYNPVIPLSDYVNVNVTIGAQLPATPTFNQGLFITTESIIPSIGSNGRIRQYSSAAGLLSDGFSTTGAAYIEASLYFGQAMVPQYVWIGRQDLTAIQTATVQTGGTNYVVGDIVTVVQSGASSGQLLVTTIGVGGAVTGVQTISGNQGTSYSIANGLATTGGSGTGLTIDITAIGETPLQALIACRNVQSQWYAAMIVSAQDADQTAISSWASSATPQTAYFFSSDNPAILNNTAGNLFATLASGLYSRTFGIYSTTQNGLYPNNIHICAAIMGLAMGANTGLNNSYYDLMFKQLNGIYPESITDSQKNAINANNGNVYIGVSNAYQFLVRGRVFSGQRFSLILNLDMLASDYQYSTMDYFVSESNVPQTDIGQTSLLTIVDQCNARAAARGFIAGGVWQGSTILKLTSGTSLPLGYLSQSPAFSTQSASDRAQGKGMPIYVALILSGSIESLTIGVYPQQ
ncbi:unnamed protein product [Sphagnum jensenii]|uniref:Uncharacterized protein n=1 Tax=Sphagnum jensenii TaxID=128206 RepID=A0ABP0V6G1_9BRYO